MKVRNLVKRAVGAVEISGKSIASEPSDGERTHGPRFRGALGLGLGLALVWGAAGCHKTAAQASDQAGDPANANLAPVNGQPAQVMGQSAQDYPQQQAQDYPQEAAPIVRQAPGGAQQNGYDQSAGYDPNLSDQQAQAVYDADLTDEQASDPPPPLPDYDQPPAPDPNYLWTPGYWAWSPDGYYWVPGAWVEAPYQGALWTPGYWGYEGGYYRFYHGFWGLHIGFYGGIDYGFGYTGYGYDGGYWNGPVFFYNTAYNRVNVNVIRNVYVHDGGGVRFAGSVSFNGGRGGLQVRPRPAEIAVMSEQRHAPMPQQTQLQQQSAQNRQQFYTQNKGRPAVAAAAQPIASGHVMPTALPRAAVPARQAPQPSGFRQGGGQPQAPAGQPQPGQPQQRGLQEPPAAEPQNRPEPQVRQAPTPAPQPQPQMRTQPQPQPQPQVRTQPQPQLQPQVRTQPQPQLPQNRPDLQQRGVPAPSQAQPQVRQAPTPPPQLKPQVRPQPPPQQPRPQPQQARPQPQHQAPPPKDDKKDDKHQ